MEHSTKVCNRSGIIIMALSASGNKVYVHIYMYIYVHTHIHIYIVRSVIMLHIKLF